MNVVIAWYRSLLQSVIGYIENRSAFIPFSGVLLWYLRLPFFVKVIFNVVMGAFTAYLFYNIGFVVLQSKAKNEMLSFVSAYNNAIPFPVQLVYSYAFIFFILLIGSMLPVAILYYAVQLVHNYFLPVMRSRNVGAKPRRWIIAAVLFVLSFGSLVVYITISRGVVPWIIYTLLYRGSAPGLFEQLYKYFESNIEYPAVEYIDQAVLTKELHVAFILPTFITAFMGFLLYLSFKYLKPLTGKKFILFPLTSLPIGFVFLFLLFIHSTQQWGALGKNLAQFDNDYVCAEYVHPNSSDKTSVTGLRILQTDHQIVIRSLSNVTYTITSDKLYVKSLLTKPGDSAGKPCTDYN